MFLRRLSDFLLRGRLQALAVAFIFAFIPLLGTLSIILAAFVTLRKGKVEGALVMLAATLPSLIQYGLSVPPAGDMQMSLIMLWVVILSNILTWAFAVILREYSNWSITIELAVLLGVIAIIGIYIGYPDIQNWWAIQLKANFANVAHSPQDMANYLGNPDIQDLSAAQLNGYFDKLVQVWKKSATGFVILLIVGNALLQVLLARWWQAIAFNPGGLQKELHRIRLSYIVGFVFVAILAGAVASNDIAIDALPILCMAFFIAGLSLLHSVAATKKRSLLWLVMIYAGIILLFPASILVIALIALSDISIDYRKRFKL